MTGGSDFRSTYYCEADSDILKHSERVFELLAEESRGGTFPLFSAYMR